MLECLKERLAKHRLAKPAESSEKDGTLLFDLLDEDQRRRLYNGAMQGLRKNTLTELDTTALALCFKATGFATPMPRDLATGVDEIRQVRNTLSHHASCAHTKGEFISFRTKLERASVLLGCAEGELVRSARVVSEGGTTVNATAEHSLYASIAFEAEAELLVGEKRWPLALHRYDSAIVYCGQDRRRLGHLFLAKSKIFREMGSVEHRRDAAEAAEQSAMHWPENFDVHEQLAAVYHDQHEYSKEVNALLSALPHALSSSTEEMQRRLGEARDLAAQQRRGEERNALYSRFPSEAMLNEEAARGNSVRDWTEENMLSLIKNGVIREVCCVHDSRSSTTSRTGERQTL